MPPALVLMFEGSEECSCQRRIQRKHNDRPECEDQLSEACERVSFPWFPRDINTEDEQDDDHRSPKRQPQTQRTFQLLQFGGGHSINLFHSASSSQFDTRRRNRSSRVSCFC